MTHKNPSRSDRFFQFVLRLLPFDFRSEFGPEMQEVFREQREEAGGKIGVLRLWGETLAGIVRTAPGQHWEMLKQDCVYALRTMAKTPGFSVIALLTLSLAIGANTAIFSVINGVLLRPLPYYQGERLVRISQQTSLAGSSDVSFSVKEIEDYRGQNQTLSGVVEYHSMTFTLLGGAEPQRVTTGVVSANFFDVLGVRPVAGRTFRADDDKPGAPAVLMLSYAYWQSKLGGDPGVIGRTFEMNDKPHTVVGVLPPIPQYPNENDLYAPTSACPFRSRPQFIANRDARMMTAFGRLKPGTKLAQAQADLETIAGRLRSEYPQSYPAAVRYHAVAIPIQKDLTSRAQPTFLILLGTAGFVLLIACANVANLTLSRQLRRAPEMAVRTAMGASRSRLFRQLLTESAMLSLAGGILGLALASLGLDLLVTFAARFTPRAGDIRIDGYVLLFTFVLSVVTAIFFGTLPAFTTLREPAAALKQGVGRSSIGTGKYRLRSLLVVSQVAFSVMLLIGAGLMLRSLSKLLAVSPGFDPQNVLSMDISLNWSKYTTTRQRVSFNVQLLDRVAALPSVQSAAISMTVPLNGQFGDMVNGFRILGQEVPSGTPEPQADYRVVSPDYFRTIGQPIREGRTFTAMDRDETPGVAIVNATMARHYWGAASPIGQKISGDQGQHWWTVVGVVADIHQYGPDHEPNDELYLSLYQNPLNAVSLLVRCMSDPMGLARAVTEAVHGVDLQQPVARIQTLEKLRSDSLASPRLTTILLGSFALLALIITLAGIVGVLSLSVSQRTHEIGIRMALGATPGSVLRMVMRQGLTLVLGGLALGVAGAFALTRLMSVLLFGVAPTDLATFSAVALVSIAIAALACFWPARRATLIQPVIALRSE
jgi:putative ABC transport system permease protein